MANHSPLSELHRENGAHFREEDGWSLPLHFGKPLEEYQSVRSHVGLFDLCHRSLLRFTGPDRVSFLQGMVSNDVEKLTPGQGTVAAVLDIHGKILADIRILCAEDYLLLDLWESLKEKIVNHFNRYLIADEVEVSDLTDRYGILSVQGRNSRDLLEGLLGTAKLPSTELSHAEYQTGDGKARLIRATHTGEEGFDIILEIKDLLRIVSSIQEKGKTFSTQWVGYQAQEILRIEAGIPRYGVDMDEDNLILETGLDRAVSFTKGCYLGQEVVERIHSRGHVNRKLIGMVLEGDSAAMRGDAIHAEKQQIGNVTSSLLSPALKCPLALGYVRRDFTSPGTRVAIHCNGRTIPAMVSRLPFYKS
ncbi:MAG: aminomethyltransferase family protein [Deltaproteobacteria bacterium]|nr:aminomethyltransferase family protein [Deltaproteobacteria bacterium]